MCGPLGRGIHMSFILSRRAVCPHVSLQKQRILQRHNLLTGILCYKYIFIQLFLYLQLFHTRLDGEAFSVCFVC